MNVFLDDMRSPPEGWVLCTHIDEVKDLLRAGGVENLSLDHDLGACAPCMQLYSTKDAADWLVRTRGNSMPNCTHIGTGYDLVRWMIAEGRWPTNKPTVHSANPVGAKNMRDDIEQWFGKEAQNV